jgi:hypothetical protein
MRDRRFDRRVPKTEVVDLHWQGNTGSDEQTPARLFDVSLSGACLVLVHPVRVASLVRFAYGGRDRTASVRHCKTSPEGYVIGVEFEDTPA